MNSTDKTILRDLAKRYWDISQKPVQEERRNLWRKHNSFKGERPPIYVRAFAWKEMPDLEPQCEDPFFHGLERTMRHSIFRDRFGDDFIVEPWLAVPAAHEQAGWGISSIRHHAEEPGGSWKAEYPIKELADVEKMVRPRHAIDEEETKRGAEKTADAIGDLVPLVIDRGPAWRMWTADISTCLGHYRGIEHFMLDMMDNPEWLHHLLAFMRDGILAAHEEAERLGDWRLVDHQNQAMPYAEELEDPSADAKSVKRSDLWWFCAAQEYTMVSPAMHDEFLLQYQLPIISEFGLSSYGCCEDLTEKIDMLRQIPNLRRIAVAPRANVAKCAERIGTDYILSYRPSPADMVSYDFDPDRVRKIVRRDLETCADCHVDITLKDVETVEGDPDRVRQWVDVVRGVIDDIY